MQDLARALTENGWRVTILSSTSNKSSRKKTSDSKNITHETIVTKVKADGFIGYGWVWLRLLIKALTIHKHDVVLTMTDPPMLALIGRYVAGIKKSKHVHWCQDLYPDLLPALKIKIPGFCHALLNKMSLKAMRKSEKVVVIGHCMSKRLQKRGVFVNNITYIPNWADFDVVSPSTGGDFTKLPAKVEGVAKRPEEMFRDDSPKFRVLYAGTIGRAHPMRIIIEAAELLSQHKEIEFTFVGDKFAHSVLEKERAKRGLENIKFMPFQPIEKLRNVMENGDVHLVTMRDEAQGMLVPCKFYSGLTVGRPTIFAGPENSEISDVINTYKAGCVVPPTDGKALADAIYRYRSDGDLWFAAQEGALEAAQTFHPTKSLQGWIDLLEGVRR